MLSTFASKTSYSTSGIIIREVPCNYANLIVCIVARTSTGCYFAASEVNNSKKMKGTSIGVGLARRLVQQIQSPSCVDEHLQDQLLIFMALARGISRMRVGELTPHSQAGLYVLSEMTGCSHSFEDGVLTIEGIGKES